MSAAEVYPVRVDAPLDVPLSRWLWIVKWVPGGFACLIGGVLLIAIPLRKMS